MPRGEPISREEVFVRLRKLGVGFAHVPFQGGDDSGGLGGDIRLCDPSGHEILEEYFDEVHMRGGDWPEEFHEERTPLFDGLTAPIWRQYGSFAGEYYVHGEVIWNVAESKVYLACEHRNEDNPEYASGCDSKDWYLPADMTVREI